MDIEKLKALTYATSWVENYLDAMIKDQPHHKQLLESYLIVVEGVSKLTRENADLRAKLAQVQQAIN